jgi:hypothetical protein
MRIFASVGCGRRRATDHRPENIQLIVVSLHLYAKCARPAFRTRQHELGNLNAILNDNKAPQQGPEPAGPPLGGAAIGATTERRDEEGNIQRHIASIRRRNHAAGHILPIFGYIELRFTWYPYR